MKLAVPFHRRPRRAMTFVEMMFAVGISITVSVPIMSAILFVFKTQATTADQTRVRLETDKVIQRLTTDIRNTSANAYNWPGWPSLVYGKEPPNSANIGKLTLLDSNMGNRVVWVYDRPNKQLTRTVTNLTTDEMRTETYQMKFQDLILEAIPTDPSQPKSAIRIVGRTFLRLKPNNTVWKEVDGNNDGKYTDDRVGVDLFGHTAPTTLDNPKWQYIFNLEAAFRNT